MRKSNLIVALLLVLILGVCLVACGEETDNDHNNDGWGNVFTHQTAYAEAQSLGYEGSFQEFINSITGKDGLDGVGIKDVSVNIDGNLIITFTNNTVINCGSVKGDKGEIGATGEKGDKGDKGDKGEQGVSIVSTSFDKDGNTVIVYSNGTTQTVAHNWEKFYTLVQVACETVGQELYSCTECGLVRHVTVAALGHDYGEWIGEVSSTCTEEGNVGHYHCSKCEKDFDAEYKRIDNVTIQVIDHEYSNVIYNWSDDYNICTASHTCINVACKHVENEKVDASISITQKRSCENAEITT